MSNPTPFQSGIEMNSLSNWFAAQTDPSAWPRLDHLESNSDENSVTLDLTIPAHLPYFAGHFPEQAVLPGVVQVHWAGEISKWVFGVRNFVTLQGSKFNGMVLPDTQLQLTLAFRPDKNSVKYTFADPQTKYSAGTLVFKARQDEVIL